VRCSLDGNPYLSLKMLGSLGIVCVSASKVGSFVPPYDVLNVLLPMNSASLKLRFRTD